MGQKVHPHIFRIGIVETWRSRWFVKLGQYKEFLQQDDAIRNYLEKKLRGGSVTRLDIERARGTVTVSVSTAKPGVVIGRGGAQIEEIKKHLQTKLVPKGTVLTFNVYEVAQAGSSARALAENIAIDLEKRTAFRRAVRQAMQQALKAGVKGIKVTVAGRLNGAEIAREETFLEGTVPLHTLRANIDFSRCQANTTYGAIGVKVWISKGLVFDTEGSAHDLALPDKQGAKKGAARRPQY